MKQKNTIPFKVASLTESRGTVLTNEVMNAIHAASVLAEYPQFATSSRPASGNQGALFVNHDVMSRWRAEQDCFRKVCVSHPAPKQRSLQESLREACAIHDALEDAQSAGAEMFLSMLAK